MRRMILPLMLLAIACQPATIELTEERKAEIAAEVTAINTAMWDAWRAADFDRGISYFDTADFAFAYEGMTGGSTAFDELWRPAFDNVASQTVAIEESEVTVLAPDVVYVMEYGTYAQTHRDGSLDTEGSFAFTGVWVLTDGAWKLRFMHESVPAEQAEST